MHNIFIEDKGEMMKKQKIILCGGGTLGHFTPNIAIFEALKGKYDFIYIGTKSGLEKGIATKLMEYREVETAKLDRNLSFKSIISNFCIPFKLILGIRQAKKIIKKEKPALIFSKGGFASVPVILAGHKLGVPCITHESDLSLGLANKLIASKCKAVCTSFSVTASKVKNGVFTGTPIRKQIFNGSAQKLKADLNVNNPLPYILVLGGSLGSANINTAIRRSINELAKNFNILHITGKGKIDNSKTYPKNYFQIEYAKNIEDYFALANVVITRGGSNTLFELLALKKPMLIIPLSAKVSRGDQIENAKYFNKSGFANILMEEDLKGDVLQQEIAKTLKMEYALVGKMSATKTDGTKAVCEIIEKYVAHKFNKKN